jgi:hypothetical protein
MKFKNYLLLILLPFSIGLSSAEELCNVGGMTFTVPPNQCKYIDFNNSAVVTFDIDIPSLQIVRSSAIDPNHLIIRTRRNDNKLPRTRISVMNATPISIVNGVKEYKVLNRTIYEFTGSDGATVYVVKGLLTFETNRIVAGNIELLYQFDLSNSDFVAMDNKVLKLLNDINFH